MAIGDKPNSNLFGTDYNAEEEASLAAQSAMMGAVGVPATAPGQAPVELTIAPPMTGLRPVDPQSGEFLSQEVIDTGKKYGFTFPSQVSLPVQQASQVPVPPIGQEKTPAALGGTTLNEYLNTPAGTKSNIQTEGSLTGDAQAAQGTPNVNQVLQDGIGPFQPGGVDFSKPPTMPENKQQDTQGQQLGPELEIRRGKEGSPQGYFNAITDERPLTPEEIQLGKAFADRRGFDFNPRTGFSSITDPGSKTFDTPATLENFRNRGLNLGQFMRYEDDPSQRTEQFVDEQGRLRRRLTVDAATLQGFSPERIAQDRPLAPEFAQAEATGDQMIADLRAEEAAERGEGKMSYTDAKIRARGLFAAKNIDPSSSQLRDLARSIQAAEPERLEELETKRAKDQGESADKDSFNTSISNSTSPQGVIDYNQALNEYVKGGGSSKGYLEFLRKGQELEQKAIDAGKKPEITAVEIGGFRVLLQDGRYMTGTTVGGEELSTSAIRTLQGRIELLGDAEEDYLSGDPERMKKAERTITALDIKNDFGGQLTAKDYFEPNSDDKRKPFDPDALTGKDKEAYDFAIKNPDAPQSNSILRLLGAN